MPVLTTQSPMSYAAHEAVIDAMYQQIIDGWNRGDAHAFAGAFAEDADYVRFDGTRLKGRREIAAFHEERFARELKGAQLVGHVESVRFLTPEFAILHATGTMSTPGAARARAESIHTMMFTQHGGEWRVAVFQNTARWPQEQQAFLDDYQTLPSEAQHEVRQLVSSLKDRATGRPPG